MARRFASEKNALGTCDRCGLTYKLSQLKPEFVNRNKNNLRVCPECFDEDHPQNQLGRQDFSDPQALRDPRIDKDIDASRNDGSIQYNFDSDTEGWTVDIFSSLTWLTSKRLELITFSGLGVVISPTALEFDSSVYKFFRVRIKSVIEVDPAFWQGLFSWRRTLDPSSPNTMFVGRPVFEQMGEEFHLLTFDLRNEDGWNGMVKTLHFHPYNVGANTIHIEYIRISKS